MHEQSYEFLYTMQDFINKWFSDVDPDIGQNFYKILSAFVESHELIAKNSKNT